MPIQYAQAAARATPPPTAAQHLFPQQGPVHTQPVPPSSHVIQPPISASHDYPKHYDYDQLDDKNNETFDANSQDPGSLADISTATMDKLSSSGTLGICWELIIRTCHG
jgi:hypothetical protein